MFKNPGKKLKVIAKVFFWIYLVIFVAAGLAMMFAGGDLAKSSGMPPILTGIIIIVVGFIIAWLSTLMLYAVGSAVADIHAIKKAQCKED